MRLRYAIKTAPASEPVTTAEAKSHMYVTDSADDTYIGTLITAARRELENKLDRAFYTQTWYAYADQFPDSICIPIHKPPLASVTAITYYDIDGVQQTFSAANYQVDTVSLPARIMLVSGQSWPSVEDQKANAVRVEFVCGTSSVPEEYKLAIKMLVAHAYQNREATISGEAMRQIELGMDFFAMSNKVYSVF